MEPKPVRSAKDDALRLLAHMRERLLVAGRKDEFEPCVIQPVEVDQLRARIANVAMRLREEN